MYLERLVFEIIFFCVELDVDGCSHRHLRCVTDKLCVLLLRLVLCELSCAININGKIWPVYNQV